MPKLTHGSLFSGIGGFDLGFAKVGIRTIWQVEIDEYCQKVLARHFPGATRYEDVRTVGKHNLAPVDIISGGFPCQDISNAGQQAGIEGEQSGLWAEYARIICELRPKVVLVENVSALLIRGMERVLRDLASCGYDAEWDCIRACDVGAPHLRDRIWILAYPSIERNSRQSHNGNGSKYNGPQGESGRGHLRALGYPYFAGLERQRGYLPMPREQSAWASGEISRGEDGKYRLCEPGIPLVAHGVPNAVERIKSSGNAIIPQIAEWIGRRIVEANS